MRRKPGDWQTNLTEREHQVAQLLVAGKRVSEVAVVLKIDNSTVATYKQRIFRKMGVTSLIDFAKIYEGNLSSRDAARNALAGMFGLDMEWRFSLLDYYMPTSARNVLLEWFAQKVPLTAENIDHLAVVLRYLAAKLDIK